MTRTALHMLVSVTLSLILSVSSISKNGETNPDADLKDLVQSLANRVDDLEEKERKYESKIAYLEAALEENENERDKEDKKRQSESEIQNTAFYAHVNQHINGLRTNQQIAFDKVYTNIGNSYDANTGTFTAPSSGLYAFSMTIKCTTGHNEHYYMALNGHTVGDLYIHGSVSVAASASRMAVLELRRGDMVSVRNAYSGEGVYGQGHSSFAGFMLGTNYN